MAVVVSTPAMARKMIDAERQIAEEKKNLPMFVCESCSLPSRHEKCQRCGEEHCEGGPCVCHNCWTQHPSTEDEIAANLAEAQALVDNETEFNRYSLHGFRYIARALEHYARGRLGDSEIATDESIVEEIQWELCELVHREEYDAAKMAIMAFRDFIDLDFFTTSHDTGGGQLISPVWVQNRKHSANYPMLSLTLSDVRAVGINYRGINSGQHPDVIEMFDAAMGCFLVRHGANPNLVCTGNGMTVLHCVANNAKAQYMKTLLALGADPNSMGQCGMTPLHMAAASSASHDRLKCVRILLDHGADVEVRTGRMGYTPAMVAGFESNHSVQDLIKRCGVCRRAALTLVFCYDQQMRKNQRDEDNDAAMTSATATMTLPDLSFDMVKVITLMIRRDY